MVSVSLYVFCPAGAVSAETSQRYHDGCLTGAGGFALDDGQLHVLDANADEQEVDLADNHILKVVSAGVQSVLSRDWRPVERVMETGD